MADEFETQANAAADLMRSGAAPNLGAALRMLSEQATAAEATAEERQMAEARSSLGAGASPPGTEPEVPAGQASLAAFHDARNHGASRQDAQRAGLQELFNRAAAGDPTACYALPGETPQAAKDRYTDRLLRSRGLPGVPERRDTSWVRGS